MNTKIINVIIILFSLLLTSTASAVTFSLKTGTKNLTLPDGTTVTMWGFGLSTGAITIPGPLLTVPPGDTTLTISLKNTLAQPVSIVIPGQTTTLTPGTFLDAKGRQRVRSFTQETAQNQTKTYTWTNVKPGTYTYFSGTQPAVQVQMGLYGGVKKNAATNQAYSGISYNKEIILFYSEIDPYLHQMVKQGKYGAGKALTSTINYRPKYFLINGQPYSSSQTPVAAGTQGQTTLIRFLNMGLKTHVPTLNGLYMRLIAEDGNLYPYPHEQYSVVLAAGKTIDALVTPAQGGTYALYDRKLDLTNNKSSPGGMLTYLNFTIPAAAAASISSLSEVSSSGGLVNIVQTKYTSKNEMLLVQATCQAEPNTVNLIATARFGEAIEPLGKLIYKSKAGIYQKYFTDITTSPDSVTVTCGPTSDEIPDASNNTETKPVPFKQQK